jgi:dTDP-4-dehydrorhamnose reductase
VATAGVETARIDLRDEDALRRCVADFRPTHILHVGALTSVADAFERPADARAINATATGVLACAAAECGARLVYSSTDMVFDGCAAPYREGDPVSPPGEYGRSKAAGERLVAGCDRALIVRIPLLYGFPLTDRPSTLVQQVAALRQRTPLRLFTDEHRTPVWVVDAARALIALARSGLCDGPRRPAAGHDGVIHLAGPERLSRFEMVERFARLLGIADPALAPVSRLSIDAAEPRPADLSLLGERFARLFPECAPGPIRKGVFAGA